MKSKDIEKFFDENRADIREPNEKRKKKLAIAFGIIFPANIASLICCFVFRPSPVATGFFVASVMAVIGYCYFIVGYNAAQQDNMDSLGTFIDKWSKFKKTTKKKKEDKE